MEDTGYFLRRILRRPIDCRYWVLTLTIILEVGSDVRLRCLNIREETRQS